MNDLENIRKRYDAGDLDPIKQQLIHFICLHRGEFFDFLEKEERTWRKKIDLFVALRIFILDKRTLDFRADLASQSEDMRRDLDVRACGCDAETLQRMKTEWVRTHAGHWRANRVLEIIFVLNRNRDFFLKFLEDPSLTDYAI